MKKRLCSILLCICMLAGMMPTMAGAWGESESHDHNDGTWIAWDNAWALPSAPGKYYLTTDVTLLGLWERSASDPYTLCYNGHTITEYGAFDDWDHWYDSWSNGNYIKTTNCKNSGGDRHDHRYRGTPIKPEDDVTTLTSGEYYLTGDYTLKSNWGVGWSVHLCGVGNTLDNGDYYMYDAPEEWSSQPDYENYVGTFCNQTTKETVQRGHNGWTAWNEADALPTASGNYYLTDDVTITKDSSGQWSNAITIPSGETINLCLEGHTVSVAGSGSGYLMKIEEGASFTLSDEYFNQTEIVDESQQGKFINNGAFSGILNFGTFTLDGAVLKNFQSDISGAAVYNEGTFNLKEGLITADNSAMKTAVAIVGDNSTFNMTGGCISKATDTAVVVSSGAADENNHATFTMSGGVIIENTAGIFIDGKGRSNVSVDDTFQMTGGAISLNKRDSSPAVLCAKYNSSYAPASTLTVMLFAITAIST